MRPIVVAIASIIAAVTKAESLSMSFALDIAALDIAAYGSMSMDGIEYMSYMSMDGMEYGTFQAGTTSKGSKRPQVAKAGKKTGRLLGTK